MTSIEEQDGRRGGVEIVGLMRLSLGNIALGSVDGDHGKREAYPYQIVSINRVILCQ